MRKLLTAASGFLEAYLIVWNSVEKEDKTKRRQTEVNSLRKQKGDNLVLFKGPNKRTLQNSHISHA